MSETNRSNGNAPWQVGAIVSILVSLIGAYAVIKTKEMNVGEVIEAGPTPLGSCKTCKGSGKIITTETCKKCQGKGTIICARCGGDGIYVNQFGARFNCNRFQDCDLCSGIGKIISIEKCPKCSNTKKKQ